MFSLGLNRRRTSLCSTYSKGILRVPQQNGEPYLKGNADIMKTGNMNRETKSVYFDLINVNLPSHLSERKVEPVNIHTGHIFIRYKIKIYSLQLHSSDLNYPFSSIDASFLLQKETSTRLKEFN